MTRSARRLRAARRAWALTLHTPLLWALSLGAPTAARGSTTRTRSCAVRVGGTSSSSRSGSRCSRPSVLKQAESKPGEFNGLRQLLYESTYARILDGSLPVNEKLAPVLAAHALAIRGVSAASKEKLSEVMSTREWTGVGGENPGAKSTLTTKVNGAIEPLMRGSKPEVLKQKVIVSAKGNPLFWFHSFGAVVRESTATGLEAKLVTTVGASYRGIGFWNLAPDVSSTRTGTKVRDLYFTPLAHISDIVRSSGGAGVTIKLTHQGKKAVPDHRDEGRKSFEAKSPCEIKIAFVTEVHVESFMACLRMFGWSAGGDTPAAAGAATAAAPVGGAEATSAPVEEESEREQLPDKAVEEIEYELENGGRVAVLPPGAIVVEEFPVPLGVDPQTLLEYIDHFVPEEVDTTDDESMAAAAVARL